MENKYVTAMVTIDSSVTFDTIDHDSLLNTLHCKFGISDNATEWVNSYLRPKSCKVNIKKQLPISKATKFFHATRQCSRSSTLPGIWKHIRRSYTKRESQKI